MEKIVQCNCEDSAGNTTIRCCNDCGLPIEAFWQPLMDFKKFSLLEDSQTIATDNTLSKGAEEILDKHGAGVCRWGDFDSQEDAYVFQKGSLTREAAIKAMQEYAQAQRLQVRNEAIQECIPLNDEIYNTVFEAIQVLEQIKEKDFPEFSCLRRLKELIEKLKK